MFDMVRVKCNQDLRQSPVLTPLQEDIHVLSRRNVVGVKCRDPQQAKRVFRASNNIFQHVSCSNLNQSAVSGARSLGERCCCLVSPGL